MDRVSLDILDTTLKGVVTTCMYHIIMLIPLQDGDVVVIQFHSDSIYDLHRNVNGLALLYDIIRIMTEIFDMTWGLVVQNSYLRSQRCFSKPCRVISEYIIYSLKTL